MLEIPTRHVTVRLLGSGIAGCGNLAVSHADHQSAVAFDDERRLIRGRIINHYQLKAFVQSPRCDVQASSVAPSKRSYL